MCHYVEKWFQSKIIFFFKFPTSIAMIAKF